MRRNERQWEKMRENDTLENEILKKEKSLKREKYIANMSLKCVR